MRIALPVFLLALGILALAATGCASKKAPVAKATAPPVPEYSREFTDVQPGSRLRVIAPVTKSRSGAIEMRPAGQEGNTLSLKVSDDLIGYETSFWGVSARRGGGVSVQFTSATLTKAGVPEPTAAPTRALIHVPKYARFLRIYYLVRRGPADHDMALVGAARMDRLETITKEMRDTPASACVDRPREQVYCEWIPAGIAVRPEVPKLIDGILTWPTKL